MSSLAAGPRKIVVGVDLGAAGTALAPGSALAMRQAELLAGRFGASIAVVHSTARDEHWEPEGDHWVTREGAGDEGRAALEAGAEGLRAAGIEAELVVSEEPAWRAVLVEVRRRGADLVVVAKRSEAERDGRRLGSVSRKLLHVCPGPVWVVRLASNPEPRLILAATDLTPVGEEVVRTAAAMADAFGSELHVVHTTSLPFEVQLEGLDARSRYEREAEADACERIRGVLAGFGVAKSAKLHVGISSPTQAILAGDSQLSPDLVVMGTVSRGGVAGFLVGNTAERLLGRLDTSLLSIKPPDFVSPVNGS